MTLLFLSFVGFPPFGGLRTSVIGRKLKGILGANFHTAATGDAAQAVDAQGFLRTNDLQGAGGAFFGAHIAINAIFIVEHQDPARTLHFDPWQEWIT
jgi:hypothetical protein